MTSRPATPPFGSELAIAVAGALIFALPTLLTMEVWWLGFHMANARLIAMLVLMIPLLAGMSYFAGFRPTFSLKDDLVDAFVALAIGFAVAAAVLGLLGLLGRGRSADEVVGTIALQATAASMGAMIARSLFGDERDRHEEAGRHRRASYRGRMFHKTVGALILTYALAPTEEVVVVAGRLGAGGAIVVAAASLAILHAFMVVIERREADEGARLPGWSVLLRYSVVGHALALLVSGYVLWTYGRLDGAGPAAAVAMIVVLGLPGAVGAGAARALL